MFIYIKSVICDITENFPYFNKRCFIIKVNVVFIWHFHLHHLFGISILILIISDKHLENRWVVRNDTRFAFVNLKMTF